MVREGLTQASRVFTIHFEGEVYQISIDCRDVHTLRELIAVAVPTPPQSSPGPSSTTSTTTNTVSRSKQKALWVNNCICSFGGQRISLSTSTEVAPTILEVTWAAHYLNSGKVNTTTSSSTTTNTTSNTTTNTAGRESTSKRRRSRSAVEAEDGNDNGSNMSGNSTEDERSVVEPQRRPYWRRDTNEDKMSSKKNKNNDSNEEENDNDDENDGDSRSQSNYRRNNINDDNAEDDDDNDNDDDEDDDDGSNSVHTNSNNNTNTPNNNNSNSNEDDNDEDEDEDERSLEAVIPVIVGGVVRLINTESRDKSHQWTVYIRGLFNETRYLEHCIESVRFILDPSFTPSERLITSPPFELTEVGWGEFVVNMRVQLRHYPRPIQVMWNSSSLSSSSVSTTATAATSAVEWSSDVKVASALLSTRTAQPLAGFTRGPVLSPVVDVLSRYSYYSNSNDSNNNYNNNIMNNNSNIIKNGSSNTYNIDNNVNNSNNSNSNGRLTVVKTEVKREKEEETTYKHISNNNHNTMNEKNHTTTSGGVGSSSSVNSSNHNNNNNNNTNNNNNNNNSNDGSQSSAMPVVSTLEMCPGVVVLSHLLRFSHRPRRAHCIPPLGRPYERDEHIGYTLVQTPVVTEHYDEIVVPDPPIPLIEVLASLPEMLRFRVATVKTARAMAAAQNNPSQQQQQQSQLGPNGTPPPPPLRASDAFNEDGVSCWKYIMQEGPDDAVLAEAYLDSVAGSKLFTYAARYGSSSSNSGGVAQTGDQHPFMTFGVDPAIVLKPGRGRRKLTGAEIDLAALKSAKKGLIEAIERMRREIALRQATHIYKQYT